MKFQVESKLLLYTQGLPPAQARLYVCTQTHRTTTRKANFTQPSNSVELTVDFKLSISDLKLKGLKAFKLSSRIYLVIAYILYYSRVSVIQRFSTMSKRPDPYPNHEVIPDSEDERLRCDN